MLILLTNDDGVRSPGLRALAAAMDGLGRVVIVAPDRDRSAVGHALTLDRPLRAEEYRPDTYAVDGTPTDCVNLGIHGLLKELPDLVLSGINRGANLGDDITYSGTVSAALEASLMGVPALALSFAGSDFAGPALTRAADFARRLAAQVLKQGLPAETFLNVNFPARCPQGVRLTHQGKRQYGGSVVCNQDPRGRNYYWIDGGEIGFEDLPGSDCNALDEGYISVTPLRANLTDERSAREMEAWPWTALMDKD